MKSTNSKLERAKFFIKHFVEVYEPTCYFCKKKMDWKSFYPNLSKKQNDDWVEHHKDLNHYNNKPENRTLTHKGCHRSYHRKLEEKEIMKRMQEAVKIIAERHMDIVI